MMPKTQLAPNPVDHLFLLVGANPLPNYVAAQLLTTNNATIHLLYSEDPQARNLPSTRDEASYLANVLKKNPDLQVRSVQIASPRGIHDSNGQAIEKQIKRICNDVGLNCGTKASIGLNYTGATKPMSVHTYRALANQFGTQCRFSYLDPRRMAFWYDNSSEEHTISHTDLTLSLQTLAAMHGYTIEKPPRQNPELPNLLPQIKAIHQTSEGMSAWVAWLDTKMAAFPEHELLRNIRQHFLNLCDGQANPDLLADKLGRTKHKGLVSYDKAFRSDWLEDVALEAIKANCREFNIEHYGAEIRPKPNPQREEQFRQKGLKVPEYDLDVAAMLGYQLFAVSCIASERANGETKKHLFEAYMRARQLGGDEARVALVSYVDDGQKKELESVIQRNWHIPENIKVFGRSDIADLAEVFRDWFCTNSLYRGGC